MSEMNLKDKLERVRDDNNPWIDSLEYRDKHVWNDGFNKAVETLWPLVEACEKISSVVMSKQDDIERDNRTYGRWYEDIARQALKEVFGG